MNHWITIKGRHVLVDGDENSLSNSSRSKRGKGKSPRELLDGLPKGYHERKEALGNVLSKIGEASKERVLKEAKKIKRNNNELKNDFESAKEALEHYKEGSGTPLRMSLNEINTSNIKPSDFPKIKNALSGPPRDVVLEITDKEMFLPLGTHTAFLGDCKFKLQGKLFLKKDASWSFQGSLKAFDQPYDFNKSSHRGPIGEFSTWVGSKISGKDYMIEIRGEKSISESGKMGNLKNKKTKRWFY